MPSYRQLTPDILMVEMVPHFPIATDLTPKQPGFLTRMNKSPLQLHVLGK